MVNASIVRMVGSLVIFAVVLASALSMAYGVNKAVNENVSGKPVQSVKWVK